MTDRPDSPDPDGAEPPEIAEVRRLLADARHDAPMPDDVVARMDRVLASLGDETHQDGTEPGRDADVVPITARRRRAAALLVAAAAVVVGGVALGPHLPHGSPGSPAGSSAQDSAGGAQLGNTENGNGGHQPALGPTAKATIRHGRIVVPPQEFPAAALQGRDLLTRRTDSSDLHAEGACSGIPQDATAVPAEYRHAPAALVYRRAVGTSQVVDLYVCGSSRPIRSTTLPAP